MLHPEPDLLRGVGNTGVLRLRLRMTPVTFGAGGAGDADVGLFYFKNSRWRVTERPGILGGYVVDGLPFAGFRHGPGA